MHPDYFEGILQLRQPTKELVEYVMRFKDQMSRVQPVRGGLDCYFLSQRFLRSFGKELHKRFAGEMQSTRRIHTKDHQTGKDLYRVTVLFRCYPFRKGDSFELKGKRYRVLAAGKKLYVQDLDSNEKRWIAYRVLPVNMRTA